MKRCSYPRFPCSAPTAEIGGHRTADRIAVLFGLLIATCGSGFALNPSLDVSQYGHDAWTVRSGAIKGNIYAIAQTLDGYLWLGGEFGLVRFDGVRGISWKPPAGQRLPDMPFTLLDAHDGTLWIGTFAGLATWNGARLSEPPELAGKFVWSLLEDREGTVWAGLYGPPGGGRLCAMRGKDTKCYGEDHLFGDFVDALFEDGSGNLWAGAQTGLWRWRPGTPKRYATPRTQITGLVTADDSGILLALYGQGMGHFTAERVEPYPVRDALHPDRTIGDRDVNSNRLLRDRDGGLWIGTVEHGLIHEHQGRTDVFRRADGLSGDVILDLFEDREGNIWVATTGGLDRFRELPVSTLSVKQGLSSDATHAVLAATDGSVWIAAHDGLARFKDGQTAIFRKSSGLPSDTTESLFQDSSGRIWVYTDRGLAYFHGGRFVPVNAAREGEAYSITGDNAGNLWCSKPEGLVHLRDGHLVEQLPWTELGRHQQAKVALSDGSGLWLSFWDEGGVLYLKDRQIRESYTSANGLGAGHVPDLRLDRDGALWAATEEGGLSRIKNGRIATLTTRNGLPCDTIHWSMEDDERSLWLWTPCGLVRIGNTELAAWLTDPTLRVQTAVWDAADGVRLRSISATGFGPPKAKSTDGKLWWVTGEGVQVVDPRNLARNKLPPPVHIEAIQADGRRYPLHAGMRLPANVRDVWIDYTALSLAAPEKIHFKYMLEGQDPDWKEVVNDRQARYSNLRPRKYRFRVIACNNSGVWNKTGDAFEFSIAQAFYQANWFYAACAAGLLALVWAAYQFRVRQMHHDFAIRLEGRVDERTRIARDLHDTLLQSFQGVMFSFQSVRNLLPGRTDQAIRTLDEAIREGDEAIAEGRDAIQGLRAGAALESNLEHQLAAAGKEFAASSRAQGDRPEFRVTVEGVRQPLSPILHDEIYRMAREVLTNAFHHAHATRIEAEVAYGSEAFRLRIRDNGTGIDPSVIERGARPGHFGLPGIRERAKRIGAQLKLWSEPGAGTEAELTVPARIAYGTSHRRERLRLFRKSKVSS